jgi:hypothetical protein
MSEDDLVTAVMDALTLYGWRATHHRRSDQALTMGDVGEPDIRGIRNGRPLWIECKAQAGRLSREQAAWLGALAHVPNAVVRVVRPSDLSPLVAELARTAGHLSDPGATLQAELARASLDTLGEGDRPWRS